MPAANPIQEVMIAPGMSERIDARFLPIGTPRLLQNLRIRQGARFEKRPGTEGLATTGLPTSGKGCWLAEWAGQPVAGVQDASSGQVASNIYRLCPDDEWRLIGQHGPVVPERRFGIALDDNDSGNFHTCAVVDGVLYVAFQPRNTSAVTYLAIDPAGVVLSKGTLSDSATPRLVYANGVLYLITREVSSGTDIEVRALDTSTFTLGAETTLATGLAGNGNILDAAAVEGGTTWVIAYAESATTIRVRVMSGTTSSVTTTISTTDRAVGIGVAAYQGESVCVGYYDGTDAEAWVGAVSDLSGTNYTVRSASGSEVYEHQVCPVRVDVSEFAVVFGGRDTSGEISTAFIVHSVVNSGAGSAKINHFQTCSKPWAIGDDGAKQVLVWAHNRNSAAAFWTTQARHFVLDLDYTQSGNNDGNVAAISYEHLATSAQHSSGGDLSRYMPETVSLGAGLRATLLPWNDPGSIEGIDVAVWRSALASESAAYSSRQAMEVNGALLVSGGALYEAPEAVEDGYYISENGFPYAPEISVAVAAGAGLTEGVQYSYVGTYKKMDSLGRIWRSAPSEPDTATTSAGNAQVEVTMATLGQSGKLGSVAGRPVGEYWRSWNGGPYYYAGMVDSVTSGTEGTDTDTTPDSSLEDNPVLYTDLGILPTHPPSGARLICVGGNRMFVVGWRSNVVQFSKLIIASAPVEFCDDDTFRIFLPEAITALAWLDGALVIFSERSIYMVTGDGPNDQGVGAFSEPRRLPSVVGCDDARSLVETSAGLMFKGAGTIWLLPRGFGPPQPVGDDVQEMLSDYPFVMGAVMCANDSDELVHFSVASADSAYNDVVLVFDPRMNGWSVDDVSSSHAAVGSVGGVFTWMLASWSGLSALPIRKLSAAQYQDYTGSGTSTWITSKVGFGDWRPFGAIGWGALRRLVIHGELAGDCQLKLDVSIDHATSGSKSYTRTQALATEGPFYLEHGLGEQKGCSFRFDLYDAQPSGGAKTAGPIFYALAFEANPLEGARKLDGNTERF